MGHLKLTKLELVCKKISWRILPLIVLMFCLSMLDRTNISFVKSHNWLIKNILGIYMRFYFCC
ncbi:TPA: hypothetical protein SAR66_001284 [Campylobacter jejuni]|nr:tartrate transporter [Campylobacter jejuni subsp. doylei]HEF6240367.1 hypothetical protein [Campylobacter jejuni]